MILDPIHQTRVLLHQGGAITAQIAQFTLLAGGTKLPRSKPCSRVLRDPLAILQVGLAPRYGLDVLGVHQQHIHMTFQNVPDRLPDPVDSIATCVTPNFSQSRKFRRSSVIVSKVRNSF